MEPPASRSRAPIARPGSVLGALALFVAVTFLSFVNRSFQLDDALIYHRYVRNVLEGHGLVFNIGERVNALTSPLFTYISIPSAYLLGSVQTASVVICSLALFLGLLVWWRLFAAAAGDAAATLGVALTLLCPYLYVTYGMETCLFILGIGLCIWLFETEQSVALGVAAACLVLTRPEGVLLLVALGVEHLRQRRPLPGARDWIAPALLLAAHLVFVWSYYGSPLSDTAAVKIIQGRSGFWGAWPPIAQVGYQLEWFFGGDPTRLIALSTLALFGLGSIRRTPLFRIVSSFLLLLALFYLIFSLPNYHWYYAPLYVIGLFAAGAGAIVVWRRTRQIETPFVHGVASTIVAGLLALIVVQGAIDTWQSLERSRTHHPYRQIGEWIANETDPASTVAATEIGFLGWYSERTLIDIVGLVTPANAENLAAGRFDAWIEETSPDYIVAHRPTWRLERAAEAAVRNGSYRVVDDASVPGYQVLERKTDSEFSSVAETLSLLGNNRDPELRARVLEAILAGELGPTISLRDGSVTAAYLSPDGWTRGTAPAALVMQNPTSTAETLGLRLSCSADPETYPLTVTIEDGDSVERVVFGDSSSHTIELEPLQPAASKLVLVESDKSWQPIGKDRRWLGVHIAITD